MQTCPECGSRNEDGELFCGSCGTYLEWEETQAASAVADGTGSDDGGPGASEGVGGDGIVDEPAVGDADPDDGGRDVRPAAPAVADTAPASAREPAPGPAPSPAEAAAPATAPADAPAPAEDPAVPAAPTAPAAPTMGAAPAVAAAPAAGALGGLGGRAARAARRAADQATGGAVTTASSAASGARGRTRSVAQAPGRAAVDRASRAAGGGPLAQAAAAAAREATGPVAGGAAAPAGAPESRARQREASARPADAAAAAPAVGAQPGPTRPAKPAPRQPAARKPGAPVQRRPVPRAEEEEPPPRPGELVCGACGAGNAPHRHFCRRCGADLADAPVQPQRSWWRRLLRPEPRPGPAAGTRPRSRRRRRFPTRLVVTLVVLGLLGAGAWYARDSLAGAYDAVVDRVAGDDPVNPAEVTASSARADRPAAYVRDGILDRSWAPEGDGIGESVELVLSEPVRLVTVLVTAGNGGEEDQRLLEARPREVRLTMTTPAGEEVQDAELTDTGEPQPVSVGLSDVERVSLTILSVYGEELGAPVALAEVELQGRG